MITLYWAASLSTGLLALAFYSRRAWRSMWSTVDDRTLADTLVLIAAMLQIVFMLAAVAPDHPTNTKPPNSAFANLGKLEDRGADTNPLWMHPRDAAARGVCVGDIARVHNEPGSLDAPVEFDTNLRLGVVAMTHGFGHAATPGMPVVQAHLE